MQLTNAEWTKDLTLGSTQGGGAGMRQTRENLTPGSSSRAGEKGGKGKNVGILHRVLHSAGKSQSLTPTKDGKHF